MIGLLTIPLKGKNKVDEALEFANELDLDAEIISIKGFITKTYTVAFKGRTDVLFALAHKTGHLHIVYV